jgi:sugar lactone lactonase YvrE
MDGQQQGAAMKRWMTGLSGLVCGGCMLGAAFGAPTEIYTWAGTGPGCADGTGTTARLFHPERVTKDAAGNFYISDSYNHTIRKMTAAGVVTTLAGLAGNSGNANGTGSTARFSFPAGLVVDVSNNVFVADCSNNSIRKITPAGVVTTVAGGTYGTNDGTGAGASFSSPRGIGIDTSNNLFVADTGNSAIRKVGLSGVVTTLAGITRITGTADGTGTAARFNSPYDLTVDSDGTMYVADCYNHAIRKVTPGGAVTTFAGQAGSYGNINSTGTLSRFNTPMGVALDGAHNLFVADTMNGMLRKVTPAGIATNITGSIFFGYLDGVAAVARFNYAMGLVVDAAGNLFIADAQNNLIRKLMAGVVSTYVGVGSGSEDGSARTARFNYPAGVAVEANGSVYVADEYNHTIRKITSEGTVSTFAGTAGLLGFANGVGAAARFMYPAGMAVDVDNNVYVADQNNCCIRKITPAGVVSTFAGAGWQGTNDGPAATALFNYPNSVAVDSNGVVYVSDSLNHTIRKIVGGNVSTLAGFPLVTGTNDGSGAAARFNAPRGIAVDGLGYVYVADNNNHTIRKITPAGVVSTLAGRPGLLGSADGTGTTARFYMPMGMTIDGAGNLYVLDGSASLRKVTPAGVVTTPTGVFSSLGYADGFGPVARFNAPQAIAVDRTGIFYIADTQNNLVRRGAEQTPQLFFQVNSGQLASWVLVTNGAFQCARIMPSTGGWQLKAAGDVDGDGISDLLFQTAASDTGGWFMHTDSTARDARFWWNIGGWEIKACADYEGTGRAQVFFQTADGNVAYWKLDATGTFQSAVVLGSQGTWRLKGAGDLDHDGKAELFWQKADGSFSIWFHDGPGGTIRSYLAGSTAEWALSGATDVDGDGICDLVWQTPDTRTGGWFMNTDGTARSAGFWWPTGGWQLKAAGR